MNRRDVLAGTAASLPLALAGCLGSGDGDDSTQTQTQTPESSRGDGPFAVGDEVGLGDDRALTVAGFDASAFVVSKDGADRTVHSGKTTRYVHVALKPDGIDDREAFAADNVTLVVDDQEFGDPVFPLGGGPSQYVAAYPVPTDVTPYTASVEVDTGDGETATWELDARGIESITQTVDYAVADVSLPDAVEPGAEFTAELTVSNNGDAMAFVVQYEAAGSGRESFEVPAGEETTLELNLTAPSDSDDGDDGAGVTLDWGARRVAEVVPYEDDTTTTSSESSQ